MKKCTKCKRVRRTYYKSNSSICKTCVRKTSAKWRKSNDTKRRIYWLKHNYGITLEQYEAMVIEQNGVCKICKHVCERYGRLSVDHNHSTGEVRGLLCNNCNTSLGGFKDKSDVLRKAADYLDEYSRKLRLVKDES